MRIVDDAVAYQNRYPNSRAESYSGTAVCVSRAEHRTRTCSSRSGWDGAHEPGGRSRPRRRMDWGRTWERVPSPLEGSADWPAATSPDGTPSLAGAQMGSDPAGTHCSPRRGCGWRRPGARGGWMRRPA